MRRHPLLWLIALTVPLTVLIATLTNDTVERVIDPLMLTVIVVAYLIAALMMLARTGWAYWTLLGAGLLATLSADALLYLYLLAARLDIERSDDLSTAWLALVRALLVVGAPMTLVGLMRDWWGGWTTGGDER